MRRLTAVLCALGLLLALPAGAMAAPPPNDLPAGAIALSTTLPSPLERDTTEATVTTDDVGCGTGGVDQATVWYTFTPADDVNVVIDASESSYQVGINVFEGGPTPDTLVNCFEVIGGVGLTGGITYYLMFADIDGDAANGGALAVTIDQAPPPIEVSLTVDPVGKVNQRAGVATLTGTITCSAEAESTFLEIQLTQRVGRFTIRGFGFADTTCGPEPVDWFAEVIGDNGRFAGGKATATIFVAACDPVQCSEQEFTASVRLRR